MANKKTTKEFITEAIKVHGDKYDYSLVVYICNDIKVIIIDKRYVTKHLITPSSHLQGTKCIIGNALCRNEYFIKEAKLTHRNANYDYSLVEYKKLKEEVIIIDKTYNTKHSIIAGNFLLGNKCGIINAIDKTGYYLKKVDEIHSYHNYNYNLVEYTGNQSNVIIIDEKYNTIHNITADSFLSGSKCCIKNAVDVNSYVIKRIKLIHGDLYDCSKVNYIRKEQKIILIDKVYETEHEMLYHNIIKGMKCTIENTTDKNRYLIKNFRMIHGDSYDYSKVNYIDSYTKVIIICKKHGEFKQSVSEHVLHSCGCPICKMSKGERRILKYFKENILTNIHQFSFENCKYKNKLKFDFYLPNHNMCIEYDGVQHFKPVDFFGGEEEFENRKTRDSIKNKYCKDNDIKLLRIPYWDFNNIEKIIKRELCQ